MKLKIHKDEYFFLFWKMMTSHPIQYQGFNIILAHAREEAKNEVRSKTFIYDQLLKSIYIVHVVNINTSEFLR